MENDSPTLSFALSDYPAGLAEKAGTMRARGPIHHWEDKRPGLLGIVNWDIACPYQACSKGRGRSHPLYEDILIQLDFEVLESQSLILPC